MSTSTEPVRSACFQPENYDDPALFADRTALGKRLRLDLESYLRPGGPGRARVLVRGPRGVGKSILTRRAIQQISRDFVPLVVTVDAQATERGADAYIRAVARDLARAAFDLASKEPIKSEADMLARFANCTAITSKDVREWKRSLKVGLSAKLKFWDHVNVEFGFTRTAGTSRTVEEKSEVQIDVHLLRTMIQNFVSDCRAHDRMVVLFLDNLDQVGYSEREEEVREVLDLARLLINLRECVVVANLRDEFVSRDLRKQHSQEFPVPGMRPEELLTVARQRMSQAGPEQKKALKNANFDTVASTLSRWTDNAWGYLTWLAHLDYEPLDCRADDEKGLRAVLEQTYVPSRFYDLRPADLTSLSEAYRGRRNEYLTLDQLDAAGVDQELVRRSVYYSAVIPDWLLDPNRYILSPCLHFIAVEDQ